MKVGFWSARLGLCLCLCAPGAASADVIWDESVNGVLSSNGLAPTPLAFIVGSNVVIGMVGNAGLGIKRDYFTFTVPQGAVLSAITVLANSRPAGVSFIGIQAGPQVTVSTSGAGAQNLLGWTHFGSSTIGTNILPSMPAVYTGPLPSGTYSVWVQETGEQVPFGFDFSITSTGPSPGTDAANSTDGPLPLWSFAALGAGLVGIASRRLNRGVRNPADGS